VKVRFDRRNDFYLGEKELLTPEEIGRLSTNKEEGKIPIRKDTSEKLDNLKLSISISKRIDNLIDWIASDKPALKSILIELRIGISWNEKSLHLSWAESIGAYLDYVENTDIDFIDYFPLAWHIVNILRYIPHYSVQTLIDYTKKWTSEKLYKLWAKDSELEKYLSDNITDSSLIPDSIEWDILVDAKIPWAILAWWIDWTLDFLQWYIDLRTIPDKALMWLSGLLKNMPNEISKLGDVILFEWWKDFYPDISYILSYIAAILFLTFEIDPWAWLLAIPKALWRLLSKAWMSEDKIIKIGRYFKLHGRKIQREIQKKVSSSDFKDYINLGVAWRRIDDWLTTARQAYWKAEPFKDGAETTDTLIKQVIPAGEVISITKWILTKLNDTMLLAGIFWNDIEKTLWVWENTSIALNIYKNNLNKNLKEWKESSILDDLDNMIKKSNWELKYNLIRIKERFGEVESILNDQVIPVYKEYKKLLDLWSKDKLSSFKDRIKKDMLKDSYDKLSKSIFDKYINQE